MDQAARPHITPDSRRRRRTGMLACAVVAVLCLCSATGFGAAPTDVSPVTTVDEVISLSTPAAGAIEPGSTQPGVTGVSYDGSTLKLGSLALGDLSTAGLVYTVTTNSGDGYELTIASASGSPTLSGGGKNFPNLGSSASSISNPPSSTGFGVAASGDGVAEQAFVAAQWGGSGSKFRGLPALPSSTVVATRPSQSAAAGDSYRIDYAAGIAANEPSLADGNYSGSVRLTATAL